MGGAASSRSNTIVGDSNVARIVPLEGSAKHIRLYQNATNFEVVVLYDHQIDSPEIRHITGDPHLWQPMRLFEKQDEYFAQLKVGFSIPAKNVVYNIQQSSSVPSPNMASSPVQGPTPRKSLALNNPDVKGVPVITLPNEGEKSPEFEEVLQEEEEEMQVLSPIDSPVRINKYDAKYDADMMQTSDDDPFLSTAHRLRLVAMNRNRDMDSSQSSNDSRRYDNFRAEIKPVYPTMREDAKPRRKDQLRKFHTKMYTVTTKSSGRHQHQKEVSDVDAAIDLRTKSASGSLPSSVHPNQPGTKHQPPHGSLGIVEIAEAKTDAKLVKRRSSEKSNDEYSSISTSGNNNSNNNNNNNNPHPGNDPPLLHLRHSLGGISALGNSKICICNTCQAHFYGTTAVIALEEHQFHCNTMQQLREKFEGFDASLKLKTHDIEDLLTMSKDPSDDKSPNVAMVDITVGLVQKVQAIQYSTADIFSMQRLLKAIEGQLQVVNDALVSDQQQSEMEDLHVENHQLILCKNALLEATEKLQEKMVIMKESARFLPTIQDFTILKAIGKGGFGTVYLAKKNDNNRLYAIKAMEKERIKKSKNVRQILRERSVMSQANKYPDLFVRLFCSFQNQHFLFLVMEYVPGGDTFTLLTHYKTFPEIVVQHYIAQVSVAIAHLHNFGVVHRDIKPDNIMITSRGHAKLGDFGLVAPYSWSSHNSLNNESTTNNPQSLSRGSTKSHPNYNLPQGKWLTDSDSDQFSSPDRGGGNGFNDEDSNNSSIHFSRPKSRRRLNSRVGNYNYSCPEIVIADDYDHTIDWWALGVLCFHYLTGTTPFEDEHNHKVTMDNIYTRKANWSLLPKQTSNECRQFMADIFCPVSLSDRLGYQSSQQILDHSFFYDVDFNTLFDDRGPLVPHLTNSPPGTNSDILMFSSSSSSSHNPPTTSTNNTPMPLRTASPSQPPPPSPGGEKPQPSSERISESSSTPSSSASRKSQSYIISGSANEIPVYTLLTKQEMNEIPNFTMSSSSNNPRGNESPNKKGKATGFSPDQRHRKFKEDPSKRKGEFSSSSSSSSHHQHPEIIEILRAHDFSSFTSYA